MKVIDLIRFYMKLQSVVSLKDLLKVPPWKKRTTEARGESVLLGLKKIEGVKIKVRLASTDLMTFVNTFVEKYHAPPIDLVGFPVIIDLGSNIGCTLVDYATNYPSAKILGVEMDRDNYAMAVANTQRFADCTVLNKAIAHCGGVVSYDKKAKDDSFSICSSLTIEEDATHVEAITVLDVLKDSGFDHVDYLKMDIEGEEVNVFDETKSDLSWLNLVSSLNIEMHSNEEELRNVLSVLEQYGFRAWRSDKHWLSVLAVRVDERA